MTLSRYVRFLTVAIVLLATSLAFDVAPAAAVQVPKTLAQKVDASDKVVSPGFPIDFVAVTWDGEHAEAQVRFRHGNTWGAWQPMQEDGIEEEGEFGSALIPANDANAYQLRVPNSARAPKAVALNTTDGPKVTVAKEAKSKASAAAPIDYVTRSEWGADEKLRFNSSGAEVWPKEYFPVKKLTVHHTATANNDANPAATMRAIYRYHALDRAWGDIGYQFLVDESGRIYEGRHTDDNAATPPGYQGTNGVVAAHVGGYNSGNLGVSILGTLNDRPPTAAAQSGTETVLAELATRSGIDPRANSTYTNPSSGATWNGPNIAGHRDFAATDCPGNRTYALLPTIRQNVWNRMNTAPPTTTTTVPPTTSTTAAPPRDTTAPVISNLTAVPGYTTAAITWLTARDLSNSKVQYMRLGSSVPLMASDPRLVESHQVNLSGLAGRTTYLYTVTSTDAAGNTSTSPWKYFTTK